MKIVFSDVKLEDLLLQTIQARINVLHNEKKTSQNVSFISSGVMLFTFSQCVFDGTFRHLLFKKKI